MAPEARDTPCGWYNAGMASICRLRSIRSPAVRAGSTEHPRRRAVHLTPVRVRAQQGNDGVSPGYLALHRSGELAARAQAARTRLAHCDVCPRRCGTNRLAGRPGVCGVAQDPVIASWNVHPWEEPPISGTRGSGTIFFSGCTGKCRFCQNYPISQLGHGNRVTVERFAEMMLELQARGCHNINFVTPTHFAPQILAAVEVAAGWGLRIPLVYNTSGWETVETLRSLEGVVDLWLPDAKYISDEVAHRISGFTNYVAVNRAALKEIYRQVGPELLLGEDGIARRGMIIRHLVLPHDLSGTGEALAWIGRELSPKVHVSLMDQYFPAYLVLDDPMLGRKITQDEYQAALAGFEAAGLENGWFQDHCEPYDGDAQE
jgi:putative pyruvate formate lyase activating enzyme